MIISSSLQNHIKVLRCSVWTCWYKRPPQWCTYIGD